MRCEEIRDLLPLHSLGALEESEAAKVREHLASGCPGCAAELAAFAEAQASMPFALERQEPSAMVKARLMARVRAEVQGREAPVQRRTRDRSGTVLAAAAAVALVSLLSVI